MQALAGTHCSHVCFCAARVVLKGLSLQHILRSSAVHTAFLVIEEKSKSRPSIDHGHLLSPTVTVKVEAQLSPDAEKQVQLVQKLQHAKLMLINKRIGLRWWSTLPVPGLESAVSRAAQGRRRMPSMFQFDQML